MGLKSKFEEKIKKKEAEIAEYETRIREARAYLQALQDSMKLLPKEASNTNYSASTLRPGSNVHKTCEYLKKLGKPAHINEILKMLGKDANKVEKVNLASTLGSYVRKKDIFSRTAPNTFSLIELTGTNEEPPDGFGIDEKEENIALEDVPF